MVNNSLVSIDGSELKKVDVDLHKEEMVDGVNDPFKTPTKTVKAFGVDVQNGIAGENVPNDSIVNGVTDVFLTASNDSSINGGDVMVEKSIADLLGRKKDKVESTNFETVTNGVNMNGVLLDPNGISLEVAKEKDVNVEVVSSLSSVHGGSGDSLKLLVEKQSIEASNELLVKPPQDALASVTNTLKNKGPIKIPDELCAELFEGSATKIRKISKQRVAKGKALKFV